MPVVEKIARTSQQRLGGRIEHDERDRIDQALPGPHHGQTLEKPVRVVEEEVRAQVRFRRGVMQTVGLEPGLAAYALVTSLVFRTLFQAVYLPYTALIGQLTGDGAERSEAERVASTGPWPAVAAIARS